MFMRLGFPRKGSFFKFRYKTRYIKILITQTNPICADNPVRAEFVLMISRKVLPIGQFLLFIKVLLPYLWTIIFYSFNPFNQ